MTPEDAGGTNIWREPPFERQALDMGFDFLGTSFGRKRWGPYLNAEAEGDNSSSIAVGGGHNKYVESRRKGKGGRLSSSWRTVGVQRNDSYSKVRNRHESLPDSGGKNANYECCFPSGNKKAGRPSCTWGGISNQRGSRRKKENLKKEKIMACSEQSKVLLKNFPPWSRG